MNIINEMFNKLADNYLIESVYDVKKKDELFKEISNKILDDFEKHPEDDNDQFFLELTAFYRIFPEFSNPRIKVYLDVRPGEDQKTGRNAIGLSSTILKKEIGQPAKFIITIFMDIRNKPIKFKKTFYHELDHVFDMIRRFLAGGIKQKEEKNENIDSLIITIKRFSDDSYSELETTEQLLVWVNSKRKHPLNEDFIKQIKTDPNFRKMVLEKLNKLKLLPTGVIKSEGLKTTSYLQYRTSEAEFNQAINMINRYKDGRYSKLETVDELVKWFLDRAAGLTSKIPEEFIKKLQGDSAFRKRLITRLYREGLMPKALEAREKKSVEQKVFPVSIPRKKTSQEEEKENREAVKKRAEERKMK